MQIAFFFIAAVTLAGAAAAMSLRNPIHCALSLAVALGGLAAFFLLLGAEFVGLAQILVYIGAVAILVVFAILLTRGSEWGRRPIWASSRWTGLGAAVVAFGMLSVAIFQSRLAGRIAVEPAEVTVLEIGRLLMTEYVLALQVIALLLTAALIGAVIIAIQEKDEPGRRESPEHSEKPR